jgi:hypothetical protein
MKRVASFLLCCAALATGTRAQTPAPCCSVTAVDAATGIVSARVNATGATFQFKVANATLLKGLRVGQGVYANLGANQVSLDGKSSCCTIISTGNATLLRPPGTIPIPTGAAAPGATSSPATPCCTVSAVSAQNLITAQTTTGTYFVFSLNAIPLIPSTRPSTIRVGQKVFADFTTKQVSLDGASPVGAIQYLCGLPPPNQVCPPTAATCRTATASGGAGCPSSTYSTSTPATCKPGYFGPNCAPCSGNCNPPNGTCSDGIAGSGVCTKNN